MIMCPVMKPNSSSRRAGFSLIELMVVLGVVGLLLAIAAPNLIGLLGSTTLTGEGSYLRNQLTMAQQLAVSKSADVEVRFFKYTDTAAASTEDGFRAYQLFQYDRSGNLVPVSDFFPIRTPVVVHEGLSTLLQTGQAQGKDAKYGFTAPRQSVTNYEIPIGEGGRLEGAPYVAFRFRPDGSTDLPYRSGGAGGSGDTWYVTLVQGEGAQEEDSPQNYVCLQVNPYNGQVMEFRP